MYYVREIMCFQFSPNFQKQFNIKQECIGAEILMRSPAGNILEIVRYLEQKDKIELLDLLAFKAALAWSNKYHLPCSANFSAVSLAKDSVLKYLGDFSDQNVSIELTETIELSEQASINIELLVACGFNLCLDDFGSEHSGLNRLAKLPFSEIKLDQYLIRNLQTTETIVKCAINMAHELNCSVVAEGVETVNQFNTLSKLHCDYFQGYLFHKPEVLSI